MPKYVKFEDVRLRLSGKVRFQDSSGADQDNRMPVALAIRLIEEGEAQVEMDLSPRYAAPFVSKSKGTYDGLDSKGYTKNFLRTLCEIQSVIRILETDFGSGTAIDAAKYIVNIEKRYKKMLDENILAKPSDDTKSSKQWKFPPLLDLKLNYFNREADDGFVGMIDHTTRGEGLYPVQQMDDASESWFNATFNDDQ